MPSEQDSTRTAQCKCSVPSLRVNTGHIDNWYVQILWCEGCTRRLETVVNHQAEIDADSEGMVDHDISIEFGEGS